MILKGKHKKKITNENSKFKDIYIKNQAATSLGLRPFYLQQQHLSLSPHPTFHSLLINLNPWAGRS